MPTLRVFSALPAIVVIGWSFVATPIQAALPDSLTAPGSALTGLATVTALAIFAAGYYWRKVRDTQSKVRSLSRDLSLQQQLLEKFDSHVIASLTDLELNITWASGALLKVSGYEEHELIGQPLTVLLAPEFNDGLDQEVVATIEKSGIWRGTVQHTGKGPNIYWVEVSIEPILDESGERCGYVQIRQDVTSQKRLEELWMTDHLTGLNNRQSIDQLWEIEIKRCVRYGDMFSVLLIDIDNFKRVNDTFGHLVGDELLFQFAQLLQDESRDTDHIGRWGGEEFIVLIPNTNLSSAVLMAEKLRESVANTSFSTVGQITVSIGVANYRNGMDQDTLFAVADAALDRAKSGGRNRVEVGDIRDIATATSAQVKESGKAEE